MTARERAGQALRQGVAGAAVITSIFVVLTDVLRFSFAQEVGALLFVLALPWPLAVAAVAGVSKKSGLVALVIGLAFNWTLLQLLLHWRGTRGPRSIFDPHE